jgi:hypothetical protein
LEQLMKESEAHLLACARQAVFADDSEVAVTVVVMQHFPHATAALMQDAWSLIPVTDMMRSQRWRAL